jgi:hypothetical protein
MIVHSHFYSTSVLAIIRMSKWDSGTVMSITFCRVLRTHSTNYGTDKKRLVHNMLTLGTTA